MVFSPDESKLYIDDSSDRCHIRVFDVQPDGSLSNGKIFHDMNINRSGVQDGMKVDVYGNIYCTGLESVWVPDPEDRHLGTIVTPKQPSNCSWGDKDYKSLYNTATTSIYKIRVTIPGNKNRYMK